MLGGWPDRGTEVRLLRDIRSRDGQLARKGQKGKVVTSFSLPSAPQRPRDRFVIDVNGVQVEATRDDLADLYPP